MPLAKTKTSDLVKNLSRHRDDISEFELRSYKRDATALLKHSASEGYMCLGIIACHERDLEETKRCFDIAITNDPSAADIFTNYCHAMENFALYPEALELIEKAANLPVVAHIIENDDVVDIGKHHFYVSIFNAQILRASELAEKYDINNGDNELFQQVIEFADWMRANAIGDSELDPIFKALLDLAGHDHIAYLELLSSTKVVFRDTNPDTAFLEVRLNYTPEKISELHFAYTEHLVEYDYSSRMMEHVKVSFEVE